MNGDSKSGNLLRHQQHKRTSFTQVSGTRIFFIYQEVLILFFFFYFKFRREQCIAYLELFLTSPPPQRNFLHSFPQQTKAIIERGYFHRDSYLVLPHLLSHQRHTPKPPTAKPNSQSVQTKRARSDIQLVLKWQHLLTHIN